MPQGEERGGETRPQWRDEAGRDLCKKKPICLKFAKLFRRLMRLSNSQIEWPTIAKQKGLRDMRKHLGFTLLLLAAMCLLITGCSQSGETTDTENTPPVESTEDGESAAAQTPEEIEDTAADGSSESGTSEETPQYTDNFAVDDAAVTAFAEEIQSAVAEKDREGLADLMSFPNYVGFTEGGEFVETREDFLALGADRIFTEELLTEIAGAETEGLPPSEAGFSLSTSGRPNIIFGVSDGRLAIVGINY